MEMKKMPNCGQNNSQLFDTKQKTPEGVITFSKKKKAFKNYNNYLKSFTLFLFT